MEFQDQSATIAFLKRPETYGSDQPVKVIETHISVVFLADGRAFKLKRGIKLPYVDFSTCDLRLSACLKEVALNRRAAPDLYLGIRRITREADGGLAFDGDGELVDAVVEMNRFRQHDLFDRMAAEGRLTPELVEKTAEMVAVFHSSAPVIHNGGGADNLSGVLSINEAGFATSHVFDTSRLAALSARFREVLAGHADLLDRRERADKVRLCHGDLHLRNIYLGSSGPRLFDCIDFNDQIATVDILYDLAFLLMDLWHRGFAGYSNAVVNRYMDLAGEDEGMGLLPFMMAVRAAVRAHVTGTQIEEGGSDKELIRTALGYFDFAHELLKPRRARLIAIGGFSGSGKSTLAETLAHVIAGAPGARIIESDRLRKAMFGVPLKQRLPPDAYRAYISERVYDAMRDRTRQCLSGQATVIVNAVFDRQADRDAIAAIGQEYAAEFVGIWLDGDRETLLRRVAARPQGTSDATVEIVDLQLSHDLGQMAWHRIDATQPIEAVEEAVKALICSESGPQPTAG